MTITHKIRLGFIALCLSMLAVMGYMHYQRGLPTTKIQWPKPSSVVAVQVRVKDALIFEAVYEQSLWLVVGRRIAFNVPTETIEFFLEQATQATQAVLVHQKGAQEVKHLYGLDENNAHHLILTQADGQEFSYVLGALSGDGSSLFVWHNDAVYSIRFVPFYGLLNTLIADVIEKRA